MALATPLAASPASSVPLWELEPAGIRFVVDTKENVGYIVNERGAYARITLATGQNRVVRYIGRTYRATTPVGSWTAKSFHIQGDRITFGTKGKFLRLYRDGKDYTAYGIHTYRYIDKVLKTGTDERFFSMGCILVNDEVMEYLIDAFERNGNRLDVATVYGIDAPTIPPATAHIPKATERG